MFNRNPQRVPLARPSVRDYVSERVFDGIRKLSKDDADNAKRAVARAQARLRKDTNRPAEPRVVCVD